MLNEIHNPMRHADQFPGIRVEMEGNFDQFTHRETEHGQTEMKELVGKRFSYPVRSQSEPYLSGFQNNGVMLQVNGEEGGWKIPSLDKTKGTAIKSIHFLRETLGDRMTPEP
jgi:hypothetical protein